MFVATVRSHPQTDGASATLLMTETKAKELGLKPKAYIRY